MKDWLTKELETHPDFTVKGLKTWQTDDGGGYQGDLLYKGKKVAYFHQGGYGGEIEVRYENKEAEKAVTAYCETQDKIKSELIKGKEIEWDFSDEWLIPAVLERTELLKTVKRHCRKKTLAIKPEHKTGNWVEWKTPFSPEIKAKIIKERPEYATAVFANELI